MNFSQQKLRKDEWEAMEVPLDAAEKEVLDLLMNGYDNTNITKNNNLSLISFMKISNDNVFHTYLYDRYFKKQIDKIIKKIKKAGYDFTEMKIDSFKIKLKSADKIRIENTDSQISINEEIIYKKLIKSSCV